MLPGIKDVGKNRPIFDELQSGRIRTYNGVFDPNCFWWTRNFSDRMMIITLTFNLLHDDFLAFCWFSGFRSYVLCQGCVKVWCAYHMKEQKNWTKLLFYFFDFFAVRVLSRFFEQQNFASILPNARQTLRARELVRFAFYAFCCGRAGYFEVIVSSSKVNKG